MIDHALRLADWLEADSCDLQTPREAATLLRKLSELLDAELCNREVLDKMLTQCIAERDHLRSELERLKKVELSNGAFDFLCEAIEEANALALERGYALDAQDCMSVIRVMQVLIDIRGASNKEGFVLVPLEPTKKMMDAAREFMYMPRDAYRAMINAAHCMASSPEEGVGHKD